MELMNGLQKAETQLNNWNRSPTPERAVVAEGRRYTLPLLNERVEKYKEIAVVVGTLIGIAMAIFLKLRCDDLNGDGVCTSEPEKYEPRFLVLYPIMGYCLGACVEAIL